MFNKRLIPGIVMESSEDDEGSERARLMTRSGSSNAEDVGGNNGKDPAAAASATAADLPRLACEVFESVDSPTGASSPR